MVELVTLTTSDDCALDGAYWRAEAAPTGRLDACVLIHGATGHAFGALLRAIAGHLVDAGVSVLSLDTRGHDVVSRLRRGDGAEYGGVAFEDLDDAPLDLHAGIDWLRAQGYRRIGLAGHSLGAVKSIYTQATRPFDRLAAVIALSPPRLSHDAQLASVNGSGFKETYDRAVRWVEEGRGEDVFAAEVPIPSWFAAEQYVKKYGPEDRYDLALHLPAIGCPVLLVLGTREIADLVSVGATAAEVPELEQSVPDLAVRFVDDADHSYTGRVDEVGRVVVDWLG